MGVLGFASGLPLPLSGFTLRYWFSESGVSLGQIGLTAVIGLSYTLKFMWAPLFDQVRPPLGLGRRRGWLLGIQLLLAAAGAALALSDPARRPVGTVLAAAGVAFLSASQDIVIDAWRIETFPTARQGIALAAYIWGYRAALLVSGAGVIALVGRLGWHGALLAMAALGVVGIAASLASPEPMTTGATARPSLARAVVAPLREFLARPGAREILAFVMLFKLGEALAGTMAAPFYRAMGFDRAAVALAIGPPSLVASLAGAVVGGLLVARLGAARALVLTGFVQMASMFLYFALAISAGDPRILVAKVVLEAFAEAMADAAFITFLSGLCASEYTATQYALLSSLAAVGLRTVGGLSGYLAQALGWVWFYGLTIFAAVPAMAIMVHLLRGRRSDGRSVGAWPRTTAGQADAPRATAMPRDPER